ncbi:MAG TPA: hypothetical protein VK667_15050, partial [Ktedonobacteraceae bacterium]|nr:hypothetical protein [Ktedonobacteraceae bacterium]
GFNDAAVFAAGIPIASQSGRATVGSLTGANVTSLVSQADGINVEHIDLVTPNAVFTNVAGGGIIIDSGKKMSDLLKTIHDTESNATGLRFKGFNLLNYDLRSLDTGATGTFGTVNVYLVFNPAGAGGIIAAGAPVAGLQVVSLANSTSLQDLINLNETSSKVANGNLITVNLFHNVPKTAPIGFLFTFTGTPTLDTSVKPIVADFFSVGLVGDGTTNDQRINNAIYRWELEETGDNTSTFTGTTEYLMLNQLNVFDPNTYSTLRPISHQVKFVAIQDMLQSESRAPQISYQDLGSDGQFTPISAQQDILTHTGVISFDSKTYKIADTVTITLKDADLNVDNDLVDIYTTVPSSLTEPAADTVGKAGLGTYSDGRAFGRLADIQFGQTDQRWANLGCFPAGFTAAALNTGLQNTGFSLVETGPSTGVFTGTFEIPDQFCTTATTFSSTVGQNIKVNYVDFRDDSGKLIEVSDNAGIRGNTGSIKLDKSVYPVPFGTVGTAVGTSDFDPAPAKTSLNGVFPLHRDVTGQAAPKGGLISNNVLHNGDVLTHVRVSDRDYDTSAAGTDHISVGAFDGSHGPVAVQISRQGASMLLATAGGPAVKGGKIINLAGTGLPAAFDPTWSNARDLGP